MLLRIEQLHVRYGGITALSGISIDVPEGETVLLVGANGAGKSSTINAVIGLVPPTSGRIMFDGKDITAVPCERRARLGIGYSPEGRRVFPRLSVTDNVLSGAFGLGRAKQKEALDWLCSLFPLLAERAKQPAGQLSGGQQQMVAIGRALMSNPSLLLCDEISLGLAPTVVRDIYARVPEIVGAGCAMVIVEQDIGQALAASSQVTCLQEGRVALQGASRGLTREQIAAAYFGV